tara:strand:- start:360 stop:1031 length:672 start_codon:yes stop_codon:yes gene_type:complete
MLDHFNNNLRKLSVLEIKGIEYTNKIKRTSLSKANHKDWLNQFSLKTRFIIEPKIIGQTAFIYYKDGLIKKVFTTSGENLTTRICQLNIIPKQLSLKKEILIRGQIYDSNKRKKSLSINNINKTLEIKSNISMLSICCYQVLNSNLNHFNSLQELQKLGFEIPENETTKYINEIYIYLELLKRSLLFKKYPCEGLVIKVNSKKLQKQMGDNLFKLNWAISIKS